MIGLRWVSAMRCMADVVLCISSAKALNFQAERSSRRGAANTATVPTSTMTMISSINVNPRARSPPPDCLRGGWEFIGSTDGLRNRIICYGISS